MISYHKILLIFLKVVPAHTRHMSDSVFNITPKITSGRYLSIDFGFSKPIMKNEGNFFG